MEEKSSESEPSPNSETSGNSPQKGLSSLVGLVLIGVLLYFGLPHIQETLKGLTSDSAESSELTRESVVSTTVDGKPQNGSNQIQDLEGFEDAVKDGIREAITVKHKESFQFIRARYSEASGAVLASFSIEGNGYDLKFAFDSEFERFLANRTDIKDGDFFSKDPSFELPTQ